MALVGEVVVSLLLLPVELLVGGEQLAAGLAVCQQLDTVGLDVLFHVVALDKPPEK